MKRTLITILLFTMALSSCSNVKEIKVASFNVRISPNDTFDGENCWHNRRDKIIQMVQNELPDVFGTQESIFHQATFLDENLPNYTKYGVTRDGGLDKGEAQSAAIFFRNDRFELLNSGSFWLSETPDKASKGWDAGYVREVVWVHLREKALFHKELFFMNTHFDNEGTTARVESSKLLVQMISEIVPQNIPVVITGDFNSTIDSNDLAPLKENLMYARNTAPITDSIPTYNAWGESNRGAIIDHIFYKGVEPISYRTVTDDYGIPYLSDHYAITFNGKI